MPINGNIFDYNCSVVDCKALADEEAGKFFAIYIPACTVVICFIIWIQGRWDRQRRERENANQAAQNQLQQPLLPPVLPLPPHNEISQSITIGDSDNELSQSKNNEPSKSYSAKSDVELSETRSVDLSLEALDARRPQIVQPQDTAPAANSQLIYAYAAAKQASSNQRSLTPPPAKKKLTGVKSGRTSF